MFTSLTCFILVNITFTKIMFLFGGPEKCCRRRRRRFRKQIHPNDNIESDSAFIDCSKTVCLVHNFLLFPFSNAKLD